MEPVVLVTGGSGFVGGAVVAELLASAAPARVIVLARADESRSAVERVLVSLARFLEPDELAARSHRCRVLDADLLRRYLQPLTTREDVAPVDYVARVLCALAFATGLKHRVYHVSAGLGASVSAAEMAAAFDAHHGDRLDDPIAVSDVDSLWRERERLSRYLGPGDEERFLRTLEIYFHFCRMPAEVFDNTRLLAEGIPAPPPFTSYLGRCVESSRDRSVYDQMRDDG